MAKPIRMIARVNKEGRVGVRSSMSWQASASSRPRWMIESLWCSPNMGSSDGLRDW
jgi:hypothetical protein